MLRSASMFYSAPSFQAQRRQVMCIVGQLLCAFQLRNQPRLRSPSCLAVKQRPGSQAKQGRKTDSADGHGRPSLRVSPEHHPFLPLQSTLPEPLSFRAEQYLLQPRRP